MATQEGNSLIGGSIEKPPDERDMDMAETGVTSGTAIQRLGKPMCVSFTVSSEQWERNNHAKRLQTETSMPVSALGDGRIRMERTVRQPAGEVTQLPQTIDRMAGMLEAHMAHEVAQWLRMREWLEDMETKCGERSKDNVQWGTGIADITAEVPARVDITAEAPVKARVREAAPAQEVRKEAIDETTRQDGGGLEASQHEGAMQDGEPEKHQLLRRQQNPKPKLQLTLQPEPRHKPKSKPKPTPIPARRWETVQAQTESQTVPTGPGPALTMGSSIAERGLILRRDKRVPPPNKMDRQIASAINRAVFHLQTPAHIRILEMRRNAKGTITRFTNQNATAEMALQYRDIIITTARTVEKAVVDVE